MLGSRHALCSSCFSSEPRSTSRPRPDKGKQRPEFFPQIFHRQHPFHRVSRCFHHRKDTVHPGPGPGTVSLQQLCQTLQRPGATRRHWHWRHLTLEMKSLRIFSLSSSVIFRDLPCFVWFCCISGSRSQSHLGACWRHKAACRNVHDSQSTWRCAAGAGSDT